MKKIIKLTATCLCAALMLCACSKNDGETKPTQKGERKDIESTQIQFTAPKSGDTLVTFETSLGTFKAVLYPEYAPQAVENFTGLAKEGYYDGLIFHRVVKDFVVQTGDDTGTGAGGKTIWNDNPYSVEISDKLFHFTGALGVARVSGDTNSCRSQFYIVTAPQNSVDKDTQTILRDAAYTEDAISTYANAGGTPGLDGEYTVFGQVFEGMDVVDAINNVKTENDKPTEDVIVNKVTVGVY